MTVASQAPSVGRRETSDERTPRCPGSCKALCSLVASLASRRDVAARRRLRRLRSPHLARPSQQAPAAQSAQRSPSAHGTPQLIVKGADSLHAGFVRLEVRNVGRGEPRARARSAEAPAANQAASASVWSGRSATVRGARRYPAGRGRPSVGDDRAARLRLLCAPLTSPKTAPNRTTCAACTSASDVSQRDEGHSVPPATVGEIDLGDFRLDFRLPNSFSGRGVVKIMNAGRTSHEISLVRIEPWTHPARGADPRSRRRDEAA